MRKGFPPFLLLSYAHGTKQRTTRAFSLGVQDRYKQVKFALSEARVKCTAPQGADSATSTRRMHRRPISAATPARHKRANLNYAESPDVGPGVRRNQMLQPRIGPAPSCDGATVASSRTLSGPCPLACSTLSPGVPIRLAVA